MVSTELGKGDLDSNLENHREPMGFLIVKTQSHYEGSHNPLHLLNLDHLQNSRIAEEDPDDPHDKSLFYSHYVDRLFVHFS